MKRLLVLTLAIAACRQTDGGNRPAPGTDSAAGNVATSISPVADSQQGAAQDPLLEKADAGRIQGSPQAPIWLVELSDFQCPFCKTWHDEVYPIIKKEYIATGKVRMAYVNMPLQIHPNAEPAAEAALCASAQNRFWQMHDALFATQKQWAPLAQPAKFMDSLAVAVGVNAPEWRACVSKGTIRRVVNGDKLRAANAGARSTPTFFVGSQMIEGAAPIEEFRAAIERARAGAAPTPR
jgi:protein-disulfide isomerase